MNIILSLDCLFIAYNTFCHIYKLNIKIKFYDEPWVDRYIYYLLLWFIKILLQMILWHTSIYLTYVLFLTTIPFCLQHILLKLLPLISCIKHICKKIFKFCINELVKKILTTICLTALDLEPCFSKKEISFFLKKNHKSWVFKFIKSCILLTIIKTLADGNTMSLNLIKQFYNIKAEHQYIDVYPNINNDIDKLKKIIIKRQWHYFFNPYVIELLLRLYRQKQDDTTVLIITLFLKKIELATAKVFTILSIIKIFSFYNISTNVLICLSGLLSLLLVPMNKWDVIRLIIKFIGINMGIINQSILLSILICEYSYLFLPLMFWVYNKLSILVYKNYYLLIHYNHHNIYIGLHILCLWLLQQHINIFFVILIIFNAKHIHLTCWFILLGYLSQYNLLHLLFLGIIYYLSLNLSLVNYAPKPKIKLLLLDNYKPPTVVNQPLIVHDKPVVMPQNKRILVINKHINIIKSMHNPKYNKVPK
jgi:hypothetical protein